MRDLRKNKAKAIAVSKSTEALSRLRLLIVGGLLLLLGLSLGSGLLTSP